MNNTRLGFKLLHPNQAAKELELNFNFWLIDFWLNPQITTFAEQIPENMQPGEALIINNSNHYNHNHLIIFLNGHHLISPQQNMKIYYQGKTFIFSNQTWQEKQ